MNNVAFSVYTPAPPTAVTGGQFAANEQHFLNGGSVNCWGEYASTENLSTQPVERSEFRFYRIDHARQSDRERDCGNLPVSFQMPMSFNQYFAGSRYLHGDPRGQRYTVSHRPTPIRLRSSRIYWNSTAGDFSNGDNWDTGLRRKETATRYSFKTVERLRFARL